MEEFIRDTIVTMTKATPIFITFLFLADRATAFLPPLPAARRLQWNAPSSSSSLLLTLSSQNERIEGFAVGIELEPQEKAERFNWFKVWYPIVPVEILDPEVPHQFHLLGMDIVVWNDAPVEGGVFGPRKDRPKSAKCVVDRDYQWRAFVDQYPHRKVSLSEGRVEHDGSILCSYHAWTRSPRGYPTAGKRQQ